MPHYSSWVIASRVCLKEHIWDPDGALPSVRRVPICRGPGQEEARRGPSAGGGGDRVRRRTRVRDHPHDLHLYAAGAEEGVDTVGVGAAFPEPPPGRSTRWPQPSWKHFGRLAAIRQTHASVLCQKFTALFPVRAEPVEARTAQGVALRQAQGERKWFNELLSQGARNFGLFSPRPSAPDGRQQGESPSRVARRHRLSRSSRHSRRASAGRRCGRQSPDTGSAP